jgi:DNA-binding FadR family transcriptional regulator
VDDRIAAIIHRNRQHRVEQSELHARLASAITNPDREAYRDTINSIFAGPDSELLGEDGSGEHVGPVDSE